MLFYNRGRPDIGNLVDGKTRDRFHNLDVIRVADSIKDPDLRYALPASLYLSRRKQAVLDFIQDSVLTKQNHRSLGDPCTLLCSLKKVTHFDYQIIGLRD
jgi:hypothetical protein